MKKLLLILLMSLMLGAKAQIVTKGSCKVLRQVHDINFVMDFSKAQIMGQSEIGFSIDNEDWAREDIVTLCVNNLNKQLNGKLVVNTNSTSALTLKLIVIKISKNGAFYCKAELTDNEKKLAEIHEIRSGYGDLMGASIHRIKVGAQKLGVKMGKFLGNQIR